ncbi:hypothetical protein LPJ73_000899, partial [Coemansia sp. RSA 2703]
MQTGSLDYRDSTGYFHEDVLQVLGRPSVGDMHNAGDSVSAPAYRALNGGNFSDSEPFNYESRSDTTSDTSETTSGKSFDADAEWEEVKQILYTTFVGMLVPVVF